MSRLTSRRLASWSRRRGEGHRGTVWGDDEERSKKITEYYTDVLNKIGLNAKPKIIGAETYFQTIGDFEGVNPVTMFDDWFQDFPPRGLFLPAGERVGSNRINNQNHSVVRDKKVDQLAEEIKAEASRMWWNRPRSWTGT